MIEIEINKKPNSVIIYVKKTPETIHIIHNLKKIKKPTADYFDSWQETKKSCIAHSWIFPSLKILKKLPSIIGNYPVSYERC